MKPVVSQKRVNPTVIKNIQFQPANEPLAPTVKKYLSNIPSQSETVTVRKLSKKLTRTGRTVNSPVLHYCVFCNDDKPHQKIVRHWELKHHDKEDVKTFILGKSKDKDKKKQDPERLAKIAELKHQGDYRYILRFYVKKVQL